MRDLNTYLLVGVGAGIGSVLRFIYIQKTNEIFSLSKVQQINLLGSFLAGILAGAFFQPSFLTSGILGGFTTFSTMALEGVNKKHNSPRYFFIMYLMGILFSILGIYLGGFING